MPIEIGDGNNIGGVFVGENAVQKVYVGTDLVWEAVVEPTSGTFHYLVVAGAGGAGSRRGSGSGAGGYRNSYLNETSGGGSTTETGLTLTTGTPYQVTVGAGGVGETYLPPSYPIVTATRGSNSVFSSVISNGGGIGLGVVNAYTALVDGGSGGGAGAQSPTVPGVGTANQGHSGGNGSPAGNGGFGGGGGGGGAGGAGGSTTSNSPFSNAAAGGAGLSSSITGTSVTRATGGASINGLAGSGFRPTSGAANTGDGGQGHTEHQENNADGWTGANGGSGIVIVRWAKSLNITPTVGDGLTFTLDTTTSSTDDIIIFTAGTDNVTWN